jgi:hypothetical protein
METVDSAREYYKNESKYRCYCGDSIMMFQTQLDAPCKEPNGDHSLVATPAELVRVMPGRGRRVTRGPKQLPLAVGWSLWTAQNYPHRTNANIELTPARRSLKGGGAFL